MTHKALLVDGNLSEIKEQLSNKESLQCFFTSDMDDESDISIQSVEDNTILGRLEFQYVS